jgi:hypothetical protein
MYRIRSPDGAEAVYNSLEEFTAAVRRGEVAPDDEIFHQRANRWLDVKSHPHYRSAMNWSGQGLPSAGAKVSAPPASVSTPPPRPAVTTNGHAPPNGHPAHGTDRLGLSRPVPPTVYRAQVESPKPLPAQPPQAQPPKSKDLTFIDLGAPGKQSGAPSGQQAGSPPAEAQPPTPPKPVNELDFLVMATGLEAPVRKSNGHKTVTEDLDLLFDTPVRNATPPAAPAAVSVPASGPTLPPAPPVEPARPRVSAPRPAIVDPPKHEPPRSPVVNLAHHPGSFESDMGIPSSALLETALPDSAPLAHPVHTPTPKADKTGLLIGAAAVVMVVTGALLVWRPWSGGAEGADVVTTSSSTSQPSAPPPGLMPHGLVAGTTGEPVTMAVPVPDSTTVTPGAGDSAAQADSAAVAAAEEIIATSRQEFSTLIEVAAPDLTPGVGAEAAAAPAPLAPMELVRRLESAERQVHQDLVARLIGFRNVLGSYRLDTREGITQARGVWNNGADAIRQYRARIGRLEQAYEDSVLASQRSQRWSGEEMRRWATRRSLAEPAETSQLADLMFSQVGEALDILAAMEGQYEVKGNIIRFRNPASASRFVMVRTWVEQRMGNWATTPESARPFTVTAILQALGEGLPSVE